MNRVVVVSQSSDQAVTLVEAKTHLRVTFSDDDTLITSLVAAACGHAELFLGRTLIERTLDLYLDAFPKTDRAIALPLPPLLAVTGMFYVDDAGVEQAFTGFEVDTASEPGRVYLAPSGSWPTAREAANAGRIRYRAGYVNQQASPDEGAVPEDIKSAIKLMVGTLYEHRETIVVGQIPAMLPWAAEALLRRHRIELSMA